MKNIKCVNKNPYSIEEWSIIIESLALFFSKKYNHQITEEDICNSLFIILTDKYNIEWPGDLIDTNIKYNEALELLLNFNFKTLEQNINIEYGVIPNDLLMGYKARFKAKGTIWYINKYDKDPFPSNPHAHQLENNLKLDLRNGMCYKIKQHIYTISKKDLIIVRTKASEIFDGDLPMLEI